MQSKLQKPHDQRFLRRAEVERRTGYSIASIYRLGKQGQFPKPVKIGWRASGWLESEVQAWMDARVAASRGGHAQ